MGNPFYNRFQNQPNNIFELFNNRKQELRQQFNVFCSQFQGDPREQVQNLLDSGKMTQEQFNYLSNLAKTCQGFFK